MKQFVTTKDAAGTHASSPRLPKRTALFFTLAALLVALLNSGCKKECGNNDPEKEADAFFARYGKLPPQTLKELKAARAATARYRHIKNAIADGYTDINVVVQHMGYHYMKASLADSTFEKEKPEILVYNKMENGKQELVAVEYAVPIPLSPDYAPEGFTGSSDVWKYDTGFNLWLLHAWVWKFNPDGVFNPTNPLVHLH